MNKIFLLAYLVSFSVIFIKAQPCVFADKCSDITQAQTLQTAPTDINCGNFIVTSINGCITPNALPDAQLPDCGAAQNPTVWFKITVDEQATQLFTFVETGGTWEPVWAVYSGNCDNLKLVPGGKITNPTFCSNGDTNNEAHNVGIPKDANGNPITTLYVAFSAVGIINDPNFIFSTYTQAACVSCIGNDACESEATFKVINRSSQRDLNDPVFEPNESAKVCVEFFYDPSETGSDWLHGLLPDFGYGWDLDLFNAENIEVSPSGAIWYSENNPNCFPKASTNLPLLCTYRDKYNNLRLCNIKCGGCPCTSNLPSGAPLPSGWFWTTPGGEGCLNTCLPSNTYGIPGSDHGVNVKICMILTTKSIDKISNQSENLDLKIRFNTTSMGVSGCWNDPIAECLLDVTQVGPNWIIDPTIRDTCYVTVYDTVQVTDTLFVNVYDTIVTTITETISVTDTLIINLNIPNGPNDPITNRIIVYPNPASSHVYIDFGNHILVQNYSCQILNALGQPVFFTPIDQKLYYLDLNTWGGKGTYFIKMINDFEQTVETKKIILQ